ncbi:MAG: hypothetical protein Kow0075_02450 [Salibacteraceae bacterium]
MKAEDKKRKELIDDLRSGNETKVIAALKRVPSEGSVEMIEPLLELLETNPSREVGKLLDNVLNNLKNPHSVDGIVKWLKNPAKKALHARLLSAIWHSGLPVSEHVVVFTQLAIDGDYMTAVEVMTVLDNTEGFTDEDLSESIRILDKAIETPSDKTELLGNIRQVLLEKLLD